MKQVFDLRNKDIDKKKAIQKVITFFSIFTLSCALLVSGVVTQAMAQNVAADNYDQILEDAAQVKDYSQKIALYKRAINVPNQSGNKAAYLNMISEYKANDGKFTEDEVETISNLVIKAKCSGFIMRTKTVKQEPNMQSIGLEPLQNEPTVPINIIILQRCMAI